MIQCSQFHGVRLRQAVLSSTSLWSARLADCVSTLAIVLAIAFIADCSVAQQVWHVLDNGGLGTGNTWASAASLDYALDHASSGDHVWVAEGVYVPTVNHVVGSTDDRDRSFLINKSLTIIGGFLGYESSAHPLGCANATILSGNLVPSTSTNEDSSYHVVSIRNAAGTKIVLRGLKIQDGKAYVVASPADITDSRNLGAGLFIDSRSTVDLSDLIIYVNSTNGLGGGMYCKKSLLTMKHCVFLRNVAHANSIGGGAGMYCQDSIVRGASLVFSMNGSGCYRGGGALLMSGDYQFANCVFERNDTSNGSGAAVYIGAGGSVSFWNSSFGRNQASGVAGTALTIDMSTASNGYCLLQNCLVNDRTGGGSSTHFISPPAPVVFEATSSFLDVFCATEPNPSTPIGGATNWYPTVGCGTTATPPFYFANNLAMSIPDATNPSPLAIGALSALPADFADVDGDGNTSESLPYDRERNPRTALSSGGASTILSVGAFQYYFDDPMAVPVSAANYLDQYLSLSIPALFDSTTGCLP